MSVEYIESLIMTHGYWIVFLGSLVEGESIIITASMLAYGGYLSIQYIIFLSFLGSTMADQALFLIGRRWGGAIVTRIGARFPNILRAKEKAMTLLEKSEVPFIFGFRFIYGIRVVSPLVIGMSKITKFRFFSLNILSAIVWAVISCLIGYYLGRFLYALPLFYRFLAMGSIGFAFTGLMIYKLVKSSR